MTAFIIKEKIQNISELPILPNDILFPNNMSPETMEIPLLNILNNIINKKDILLELLNYKDIKNFIICCNEYLSYNLEISNTSPLTLTNNLKYNFNICDNNINFNKKKKFIVQNILIYYI